MNQPAVLPYRGHFCAVGQGRFGHGLVQHGFLYPRIFPHHKRPTDDQHAGTIAWGKEKAGTRLEVLDKGLMGGSNWAATNEVMYGVAGSVAGREFERV